MKSRKVRIADEADEDLDKIYAWIARESVQNADRVVGELIDAAYGLATFPMRGSSRLDTHGDGTLVLFHMGYAVVYSAADGIVEVSRVLHCARDLPGLL